ncbi:MAG TPA: Gfo/Idh/MocA family oxidoreductase [Chthoniobacterales bacterium]
MSRLRIGLIGCGHIGRVVHLETLRRLPNAQVVSLADADGDRLKLAHAKIPEAATFSDYRRLLDDDGIDAVVICLPNALHAEAAVVALERKKHVYLEKPLAVNLDEGKAVLEAWERSGRVGMIGFNYRFNPLHREMRRLLQTTAIGNPIGGRTAWTTAAERLPVWKTARLTGGGVLLDLASHHFDLMRFWFDEEIVEVYANVRSQRSEYDTASVQVRLSGGLLVENFFSMSSIEDEQFEIYGSTGKLSFNRFKSWNIEKDGRRVQSIVRRTLGRIVSRLPNSRYAITKLRAPGLEPSFSAALVEFVSAAQVEKQIHPDLEDGFKSLRVVIAAEESARLGRPVSIGSPSRVWPNE